MHQRKFLSRDQAFFQCFGQDSMKTKIIHEGSSHSSHWAIRSIEIGLNFETAF